MTHGRGGGAAQPDRALSLVLPAALDVHRANVGRVGACSYRRDVHRPLLDILAALGPLATLLVVLAAVVTVRQRASADRRDQWWQRAEWALDRALDGDPGRREMGLAMLSVLADSGLARRDELAMFDVAWEMLVPDDA